MKLRTRLVETWPKLAWVATFEEGAAQIDVLHGPMVEVGDGWVAEAVWAGDFAAGDFDRTDLVFGSGLRCRGGHVVFVTAGTAMDRLWYCHREGCWYVSNSFGGLSACAGLSLLEDHAYVRDRESDFRTTWGVASCTRLFPSLPVDARLIWFNNLIYDGHGLHETSKRDTASHFKTFADYTGFLFETSRALGENLRHPARRHAVVPVATVSSGYDSPAAAVVARQAGCERALTISQSSSFWRGSDSGEHIAERLGMRCQRCERTARSFPHEAAFWAGSGWSNLLNWTTFPYPPEVGLFFQGNYGDAVWNRRPLPMPFTFDVWDDLALGEFRLIMGMIQCPVPFWGMRHAEEINRISFSEEMAPWTLGAGYDRPIPRRIVEEAGVPRGEFAVLKKDTSHESGFRWPYSVDTQTRFGTYLIKRRHYAPGRAMVALLRRLAQLESLLHQNVLRRFGVRKRFRPWRKLAGSNLLFQWAHEELKADYGAGLERMESN